MGPVWRTAQLGGGEGRGSRDGGNTDTSNLMLGLRGIPGVQEVDRRSKSALRNSQGTQESIQEGFLENMTLLGLKDK